MGDRSRFMVLVDKNFKRMEFIELDDLEDACMIDHPFMILAQNFSEQNLLPATGAKRTFATTQ